MQTFFVVGFDRCRYVAPDIHHSAAAGSCRRQRLTFSARPLFDEENAEVVAIDMVREPAFDHDEVLEDPLEALSICSSLGTISSNMAKQRLTPEQRIVTLAHYLF